MEVINITGIAVRFFIQPNIKLINYNVRYFNIIISE